MKILWLLLDNDKIELVLVVIFCLLVSSLKINVQNWDIFGDCPNFKYLLGFLIILIFFL